MMDVNEIMQDLSTAVNEQGDMLDNIAVNEQGNLEMAEMIREPCMTAATAVERSVDELKEQQQRKEQQRGTTPTSPTPPTTPITSATMPSAAGAQRTLLEDWACRGTATQSSNHAATSPASNTIDGTDACGHTNEDQNAWWQVELPEGESNSVSVSLPHAHSRTPFIT
jgi:hypothetical protein